MVDAIDHPTPLGPILGDETKELPFGKYVLMRKIAVGGMAEVYLAKSFGQFGFEKPVVVKVLLPQLSADEEFREMFVREAVMAADFRHPRLCQVYDVGEVSGLYYIAMEFVDGVDLTRIVRQARKVGQPIPRALAIRLVLDLLDGLRYVHTAKAADGSPLNIVHRDVTPQNIMVAFDGQVKLVDFGVAQTSLAEELKRASLKGKGPYMAPEQWKGAQVDHRADLFALGVVLYELTVSKRLFKRGNPNLVRRAILHGEIVPPGDVRPDYPRALEEVVLGALAVDPEDRYQSAAAFSEDLSRAAHLEDLIMDREEVGTYTSRLFEGVSRTEVFRPLELTAPGQVVAAAEAAQRETTDKQLASASAPRARRLLAMRLLALLAVVALVATAFWLGRLTAPGPRSGTTRLPPPESRAAPLAIAHRAASPASLRGCEGTFFAVTVSPDGAVRSVAPRARLTCAGRTVSETDARWDLARETLSRYRFRALRAAGRPITSTTPVRIRF